jgi:ubiquinol-cytochrome c reductase cytochrome b subunit
VITKRLVRWLDQRVGITGVGRAALDKVFPNHWSFLLGEVALYSFVVLFLTGLYLIFFFHASTTPVVYDGSYEPLVGVEMSRAYESALELSFDVRAGLVMRQTHHWAAVVFVGAIVAHLARVFFTGAFRRPRELNWMVGVTLLLLGILNGFAGYSLLDDQLSGTGLRIAYSVVISVPVVGTWIASLLFGGDFPGTDIIERLFVLHILVVPLLIVALLVVHLGLLLRHRHTHFAGRGATDRDVVASGCGRRTSSRRAASSS